MSELIDISLPLSPDLPVWPGNPRFKLEAVHRLENGAHCNESTFSMNVHTGTHIDVPWHFLPQGDKTEAVDLTALVGPARVVSLPGIQEISPRDLESAIAGRDVDRLLLRTENSRLWGEDVREFNKDFAALTVDAAEWLAARRVQLIGIDYLSIQLYGGSNRTHEALLEAGMVILEGLNLQRVAPGDYELICLPLAIQGAEGAPARAVLRK